MEILKNEDLRLKEAILNMGAKQVQEYFIEKEKLDQKFIAKYENMYNFMEVKLFIENFINVNSLIENAKKQNTNILEVARVENSKNNTDLTLYYIVDTKQFVVKHIEHSELDLIRGFESLDISMFPDFPKGIQKSTLEKILKRELYKRNMKEFEK